MPTALATDVYRLIHPLRYRWCYVDPIEHDDGLGLVFITGFSKSTPGSWTSHTQATGQLHKHSQAGQPLGDDWPAWVSDRDEWQITDTLRYHTDPHVLMAHGRQQYKGTILSGSTPLAGIASTRTHQLKDTCITHSNSWTMRSPTAHPTF